MHPAGAQSPDALRPTLFGATVSLLSRQCKLSYLYLTFLVTSKATDASYLLILVPKMAPKIVLQALILPFKQQSGSISKLM